MIVRHLSRHARYGTEMRLLKRIGKRRLLQGFNSSYNPAQRLPLIVVRFLCFLLLRQHVLRMTVVPTATVLPPCAAGPEDRTASYQFALRGGAFDVVM